ncbi:MAG: thermonuclease family protein [Alphaproteobacteria bacterium]
MRLRVIAAACAVWLIHSNAARAQEWFFGSPRVIDGDTLAFPSTDTGPITAHLDGIDAVEDKQRCGAGDRESAPWSCGLTARLYLIRTLEQRGFLRCRIAGERDTGVPTVYCLMRGGGSLSYEMVKEGLALALPDADRALQQVESEARAARRGIWQGPFDAPWDWRRDNPGS